MDDGNNECFIDIDYDYSELNITALDKSNLGIVCPDFSLTESDKEIIFESLDKSRSDRSYIVIEKQTDEEYSKFQNEMKKVNSAICDCTKIVFYERKGIWTIYTYDFKDSCSFSTACYQPPFYCPNNVNFIPMLFLVGLGIMVTGIIFFFKKRKK